MKRPVSSANTQTATHSNERAVQAKMICNASINMLVLHAMTLRHHQTPPGVYCIEINVGDASQPQSEKRVQSLFVIVLIVMSAMAPVVSTVVVRRHDDWRRVRLCVIRRHHDVRRWRRWWDVVT